MSTFVLALTGLGERAHLVHEGIDLDTHIQDVFGVLRREELSDVALCGHSHGGKAIFFLFDAGNWALLAGRPQMRRRQLLAD